MPQSFRCQSFLGQNVLLFRYVIMYDCKNKILEKFEESHFEELFDKDGKIIHVGD